METNYDNYDALEVLLRTEMENKCEEIHKDMEFYNWLRGLPTDHANYSIEDYEHVLSLFRKGVKALALIELYNYINLNILNGLWT